MTEKDFKAMKEIEVIKLIKQYNVKTNKELNAAIKTQRSKDLQNYAAEVLLNNIQIFHTNGTNKAI